MRPRIGARPLLAAPPGTRRSSQYPSLIPYPLLTLQEPGGRGEPSIGKLQAIRTRWLSFAPMLSASVPWPYVAAVATHVQRILSFADMQKVGASPTRVLNRG